MAVTPPILLEAEGSVAKLTEEVFVVANPPPVKTALVRPGDAFDAELEEEEGELSLPV